MSPPSRLFRTQKEDMLRKYDWIGDSPHLHIAYVESVFKIEQVIACGKRGRLGRETHVSEPAERCS